MENPGRKEISVKTAFQIVFALRTNSVQMEMKPENILDEILIQAKVVCAQLLIKTNTPDIVHEILDIYMIGLDIQTMQKGE